MESLMIKFINFDKIFIEMNASFTDLSLTILQYKNRKILILNVEYKRKHYSLLFQFPRK